MNNEAKLYKVKIGTVTSSKEVYIVLAQSAAKASTKAQAQYKKDWPFEPCEVQTVELLNGTFVA